MPTVADYVPTWGPELVRLNFRVGKIALGSGQVITNRLTRFAMDADSAASRREAKSMVDEKVIAAQQAGAVLVRAWFAMLSTSPTALFAPAAADDAIKRNLRTAYDALAPYERRVLANQRRLNR